MTTYAIGDLHGCYDELQRLLHLIQFDSTHDTLWFTGDLINRGEGSLEVLQFIRSLGSRAITVLGNHDLYLLTVMYGEIPLPPNSQLQAILNHPDGDSLGHWLRYRPLVHYDHTLNYLLVHAGLPPQWNLTQIQHFNQEIEALLQGDNYVELLKNLNGNEPAQWSEELISWDRLRYIVNAFTRIRLCKSDGTLNLIHKGPPPLYDQEEQPWFNFRHPSLQKIPILFGHWSGLTRPVEQNNTLALDTACIWGGTLTALALESKQLFSVQSFR